MGSLVFTFCATILLAASITAASGKQDLVLKFLSAVLSLPLLGDQSETVLRPGRFSSLIDASTKKGSDGIICLK